MTQLPVAPHVGNVLGVQGGTDTSRKRILGLRQRCQKLGSGEQDWAHRVPGLVPAGCVGAASEAMLSGSASDVANTVFDLDSSMHLDPRCLAVGEVVAFSKTKALREYRFASPPPYATRHFCLLVSLEHLSHDAGGGRGGGGGAEAEKTAAPMAGGSREDQLIRKAHQLMEERGTHSQSTLHSQFA
jgi:hypothetical protein